MPNLWYRLAFAYMLIAAPSDAAVACLIALGVL